MERNEEGKLPRFQSLDELVSFFDGNDLGDYDLPEVEVEVNVKKKVPVDRELYRQLDDVAHAKGVTSETLIETWLREKLKETAA